MSEPTLPRHSEPENSEHSKQRLLTLARPLSYGEDAVIDGLTDEEDDLFLTAILEA